MRRKVCNTKRQVVCVCVCEKCASTKFIAMVFIEEKIIASPRGHTCIETVFITSNTHTHTHTQDERGHTADLHTAFSTLPRSMHCTDTCRRTSRKHEEYTDCSAATAWRADISGAFARTCISQGAWSRTNRDVMRCERHVSL